MVTNQTHPIYRMGYLSLQYVWQTRLVVISTRIVVSVFDRLQVFGHVWNSTLWYDGPATHSKSFFLQGNVRVHMSTFQAFVEIRTNVRSWQCYYLDKTHTITYIGIKREIKSTAIPEKGKVVLPPCTKELSRIYGSKTFPYRVYLEQNSRNLHCIYNLTSDYGFINLSISKVTYSGPDFVDTGYQNCLYGGVAVEAGIKHLYDTASFDKHASVFRRPDLKEVQYLCDNYTSEMNKNETLGKIMMNIVGHREDGLLLVVYSYEKYSHVSMEATATSTKCKGIPYRMSK